MLNSLLKVQIEYPSSIVKLENDLNIHKNNTIRNLFCPYITETLHPTLKILPMFFNGTADSCRGMSRHLYNSYHSFL